ncbi:MAG: hypothetical protein WA210_08440, partial [Burkholderiaceae bacterium]
LEALAGTAGALAPGAASSELVPVLADGTLDPTPLITRLADLDGQGDARHGAALFHHAIADGLARWVIAAAESTRVRSVALAGGCFLNALLSALLVARLAAQGIRVLEARQAPPNDGGVALGQAWVAICRTRQPAPSPPTLSSAHRGEGTVSTPSPASGRGRG